jgi:hypothetical protein
VMARRRNPEQLAIEHVRQPRQWRVEVKIRLDQSRLDPGPGDALLDQRIVRHIRRIVEIYVVKTQRRTENKCRHQRHKGAGGQQAQAAIGESFHRAPLGKQQPRHPGKTCLSTRPIPWLRRLLAWAAHSVHGPSPKGDESVEIESRTHAAEFQPVIKQTVREGFERSPDEPHEYKLMAAILEKMNRPLEALAAVREEEALSGGLGGEK